MLLKNLCTKLLFAALVPALPFACVSVGLAQEASPVLAPVTLAAAAAPTQKTGGSLRMLLLVILGALALASLMGNVVYRLGRARHVAETRW